MFDYEMSQRAFLDVWKEFGEPNEITGSEDAYKYLKRLHEVTNGLFIVDHFSYTNYDHVDNILLDDKYVSIYWKDFKNKNIDDMTKMVFGNATFIYSLCNIQKLLFIKTKNHLLILVMPIVASDSELRKHLNIKGLPNDHYRVEENFNEFTTEYTFMLNNDIHRCISHNLPFFSFLLQPKEGNISGGYSKLLLLYATMDEIKERLRRILIKLTPNLDQDSFCELGNTLRRILEYLLKYYMCYKGISLPSSNYGYNMLGELSKKIKERDIRLDNLIDSSTKRIANELSHDTGKTVTYNDVSNFYKKVKDIYEYINKEIEKEK